MLTFRRTLALLVGMLLLVSGGVTIQDSYGQAAPNPYRETEDEEEETQVQAQAEESTPFIHGITAAAGLTVYQGDLSRNPNHNIIKYVAGRGALGLRFGVDHRLGRYEQYGLGADLVYGKVGGKTARETSFDAHTLALDFYADYELPYVKQGLFRVFVGGGPQFVIAPSYNNFPDAENDDRWQQLGSRVIGSLKLGVTIFDNVRVGTRITSTELLDGHKGFDPSGFPDVLSFINVGYRFDLRR